MYCTTEGVTQDRAVAARMQLRRDAASATDIWTAVREGKRDDIARLSEQGISVNAKQGGSGSTLLNTAAVFGQT